MLQGAGARISILRCEHRRSLAHAGLCGVQICRLVTGRDPAVAIITAIFLLQQLRDVSLVEIALHVVKERV